MKKLFSTNLLAMLCIIAMPSFAQKDSLSRNQKTGSGHMSREIKKFDIGEDIRLMTLLTDALHKDGLIDKRKAYKLEIKDGAFYINDNKQSSEIADKYRKYFRADTTDNYTFINNGDDLSSKSKRDIDNDGPKRLSSTDLNIKFDGVQYQESLKLMTLLIDGLDKDGLINKKKAYKIEVKRGELYINGNKQPSEVSDRFRKYFQGNNYALIND